MRRRPRIVIVNDKMQDGYRYVLAAPVGSDFDPEFQPELSPKQMLELGVFGGKYLTDCRSEYPANWFKRAILSGSGRDPSLNYFGVDASQPLSVWRNKGWIHPDDPRGWFQWYCRYHMGRRMPEEDARQIKRWKAMRRQGWEGWDRVGAMMPAAETQDLIVEIRSATGGVGSFAQRFDHSAELTGRAAEDVASRFGRH